MCIKVNNYLIAWIMVETTSNLLVILLQFLRIKFKKDYSKLVSFNEATLRIYFEWFWNHWRKSEICWCVCLILKLNGLKFAFVQRARSKVNFIIGNCFYIWNKWLWVSNKWMAYTSDESLKRWSNNNISEKALRARLSRSWPNWAHIKIFNSS